MSPEIEGSRCLPAFKAKDKYHDKYLLHNQDWLPKMYEDLKKGN